MPQASDELQIFVDEFYGKDYADGFIQIHHLKPLSGYEGEVDPKTDLRPLLRQLPRHGPQEERDRNLHRGAEGTDHSSIRGLEGLGSY